MAISQDTIDKINHAENELAALIQANSDLNTAVANGNSSLAAIQAAFNNMLTYQKASLQAIHDSMGAVNDELFANAPQ